MKSITSRMKICWFGDLTTGEQRSYYWLSTLHIAES